MPAVMVDIETLASRPDAVIVSIGAVIFEPDGHQVTLSPDTSFHVRVLLNQPTRAIDPKTVAWWMQQAPDAQQELLASDEERLPLKVALGKLGTFMRSAGDWGATTVWSHGSDFDLVVLGHAYREERLKQPWPFRQARDTRTLFGLVETFYGRQVLASCWPENPLKHNPLMDSVAQAVAVQRAYARLRPQHPE